MEKVPLKMQKEECRTGRAGYGQLKIEKKNFFSMEKIFFPTYEISQM